jgi:hypothetical protein
MSKNGVKREIVEEALKEHRRFRRIRLTRIGRAYIPATAEEVACTVSDISAGGASVRGHFKRLPAGKAVIYLGELGQFEGPIMSASDNGFRMGFACSRHMRGKLADQLTFELNRHLLSGADGDSSDAKYEKLRATD